MWGNVVQELLSAVIGCVVDDWEMGWLGLDCGRFRRLARYRAVVLFCRVLGRGSQHASLCAQGKR